MNLRGKSFATCKPIKIGLLIFIFLSLITVTTAQTVENKDRDRAQEMLNRIKDELKKNYYDPSFRGMDVEARFKTASEKIKTAVSIGQIFGIIGQVLIELNDSHTYFHSAIPRQQNRVWLDHADHRRPLLCFFSRQGK